MCLFLIPELTEIILSYINPSDLFKRQLFRINKTCKRICYKKFLASMEDHCVDFLSLKNDDFIAKKRFNDLPWCFRDGDIMTINTRYDVNKYLIIGKKITRVLDVASSSFWLIDCDVFELSIQYYTTNIFTLRHSKYTIAHMTQLDIHHVLYIIYTEEKNKSLFLIFPDSDKLTERSYWYHHDIQVHKKRPYYNTLIALGANNNNTLSHIPSSSYEYSF
jgi:hypothetical protein